MKHAGVDRATVSVRRERGELAVAVCDAGRGFAPDRLNTGRLGVRHSIGGRMAAVGGRGTVTSRIGAGTRVRLSYPAQDPARRPAPELVLSGPTASGS
jgi:signal transduction histidine kinase